MAQQHNHGVFPVWMSFILSNPLRRLTVQPEQLLADFVKPGMTVVDVGSGPGFFSIPMAEMVGKDGTVICTDVQEGMINKIVRTAQKKGLIERIIPTICSAGSLNLSEWENKIDFGLLMNIVHEISNPNQFFRELAAVIKPGGLLLMHEPGFIEPADINDSLALAQSHGFIRSDGPRLGRRTTHLLTRN